VNGGDQALSLLYLFGCLVLVGSAVLVRRIPVGQSLKMLLVWALLFGAAFAVFALKDDFLALGGRLSREITGREEQQVQGGAVRIRRSEDGHYYVNAAVNGRPVRFMIDSGASVTMLSRASAAASGVTLESGFGVLIQTANGATVADRGHAATLTVGPIAQREAPVLIARNDDDLNVIGMTFLSSLSAWGVEGNTLVMRP
jgi:aspartyl protease family protein